MILSSSDLKGSIQDRPEYMDRYDENNALFQSEVKALVALDPSNTAWMKALYYFEIYKGVEGYRVALPLSWLPFKIDGYSEFSGHLLSKTTFPNRFQALQIAARTLDRESGYR